MSVSVRPFVSALRKQLTAKYQLRPQAVVTSPKLPASRNQHRCIAYSHSRTAQPASSNPTSNANSNSNASPQVRTVSAVAPAGSDVSNGFDDVPLKLQEEDSSQVDWTSSFYGLSIEPFSKEAADILLAPVNPEDIEIKPDGIIYLPEIKYRRILNRAFGPGGWGLAPRGETIVTDKSVTREYALLAHGRYVRLQLD